ncbi:MAG: C-GCAxxG-C-C family protein [Thermodesulfobacteriota bacterium]
MPNNPALKKRLAELEKRAWNVSAIEAKLKKLAQEGIPAKDLHQKEIIKSKDEILERVQLRAEEYEFLTHSCAKGSALAIMEEFGLGHLEIIKALSPFPGFGMMGYICGAVTGSLIALGLYFGSNNLLDYEGNGRAISAARRFIPRFEKEVGTILCPKIQEDLIFGKYMDPRGSQENFQAFQKAKGYEKCALLPGIGARIASEIIIEAMEESLSS